jgi:hypothetical protein
MINGKKEASLLEHDSKFNQIVHLNTVDQKIFMPFSSPGRATKN